MTPNEILDSVVEAINAEASSLRDGRGIYDVAHETADLWNAYLAALGGRQLHASDVAVMRLLQLGATVGVGAATAKTFRDMAAQATVAGYFHSLEDGLDLAGDK